MVFSPKRRIDELSPAVYISNPGTSPHILTVYVAASGRSPFKDWLFSLKDPVGQAAVLNRLDRLARGNPGDIKRLGPLFELRLHHGPGYRIYGGQNGDRLVILLTGGNKSTQSKDIRKAKEYWDDYKVRKTKALTAL